MGKGRFFSSKTPKDEQKLNVAVPVHALYSSSVVTDVRRERYYSIYFCLKNSIYEEASLRTYQAVLQNV
jgi:hypothetical protein